MAMFYNPHAEGKGVKKQTNRTFSHCFSVFMVKLFTLIKGNILFSLFILPFAIAAVLIAMSVFPDTNILDIQFQVSFVFQIMLIPLPFAFIGPAVCGLTKITRDIGREEHVEIFKDFLITYNRCFFKSIIISALEYLFYITAFFAFIVYWGEWLFWSVSMIVTLYFTLMQRYIYIMAVSLDLSVFKMYKNAFLLVLVAFKKSLTILLSLIVFTAILLFNIATSLYVNIGIVFTALYLFLIHFSFLGYFQNYYAFNAILEFVVEPFYNNEKNKIVLDNVSSSKNDDKYTNDNIEKEKSDYVFINGKLVKREIAETESIFKEDI